MLCRTEVENIKDLVKQTAFSCLRVLIVLTLDSQADYDIVTVMSFIGNNPYILWDTNEIQGDKQNF